MTATATVPWHRAVPHLAADQVARSNRLLAAGREALLPWAGRRVTAALRTDAAALQNPSWRFAIEWPGLRMQVRADTLDALMPGVDDSVAGAEEPVRRAVAEQLLAVLAAGLPGLAEAAPRVLPDRNDADPACAIAFDLIDQDTGARGSVELQFDEPESLDTGLRLWSRLARPATAAHLPVPLRFLIGRTCLGLAAFRALGVGDVILLDRLPTQGGRWQARLLAGATRAHWASGIMQGDTIVLQKIESTAAQAAPPTDQLGIQLCFEIGRTTLPLGALTRLAPGYVFELGASPEGELVEITTQGRTVGLGRLVLVGDAVGVRVASLRLEGHATAAAEAADGPIHAD